MQRQRCADASRISSGKWPKPRRRKFHEFSWQPLLYNHFDSLCWIQLNHKRFSQNSRWDFVYLLCNCKANSSVSSSESILSLHTPQIARMCAMLTLHPTDVTLPSRKSRLWRCIYATLALTQTLVKHQRFCNALYIYVQTGTFQTILNKLSENGFCITSMPAKKIECAFCKQHFETKEELGSHSVTHKGE